MTIMSPRPFSLYEITKRSKKIRLLGTFETMEEAEAARLVKWKQFADTRQYIIIENRSDENRRFTYDPPEI